MELEFLGTGAGSPAKQRNVTGIALKLLDERNEIWLFDVGEGTQHQILKTNIRPRKITKIFITHLHGDHIFGLPGLLSSRSFQGGEEALTIYGPRGIENFVKTSLAVSETRLTYPLKFEVLKTEGIAFEDSGFKVSYATLDHKIRSYGYRVQEKDSAGKLMVDQLHALGIASGPIYGKIKAGETISLEDGSTINGADFVGPDKKGRIVTILGDTRKNKNSLMLAENADVLVHESTFSGDESQLAHRYYHSTSIQAAQIAQKAKAKKLLLTHISARYLGKKAKNLENEAKSIFKATKVVNDFDEIMLPPAKEN